MFRLLEMGYITEKFNLVYIFLDSWEYMKKIYKVKRIKIYVRSSGPRLPFHIGSGRKYTILLYILGKQGKGVTHFFLFNAYL
jgi:hypothetical protein